MMGSTMIPVGVDSIQVACATSGRSFAENDGEAPSPSGASPMLPTFTMWMSPT